MKQEMTNEEKEAMKEAKKQAKEQKKLEKEQKLAERYEILDKLEKKFDLTIDVKLSKKEKNTLELINSGKEVCFYELCDCLDAKPSKMDEILINLVACGLIDYKDNDGNLDVFVITKDGKKYLSTSKEKRKSEKKFRKFVSCLNNNELVEFMNLCDSLSPAKKKAAPKAKKPAPEKSSEDKKA